MCGLFKHLKVKTWYMDVHAKSNVMILQIYTHSYVKMFIYFLECNVHTLMPLHKFKTEKRGRCFAIKHDLYIWFVSQVQGSMRKPENLLRRCKCLHIWMWVVFAIIRFLKSIKFLSVKLCNMNHKGEKKIVCCVERGAAAADAI